MRGVFAFLALVSVIGVVVSIGRKDVTEADACIAQAAAFYALSRTFRRERQ